MSSFGGMILSGMHVWGAVVLMLKFASIAAQLEEFHVYGPNDLHDYAMKVFLDIRKDNPDENLDYDSTFMIRARGAAVNRLNMVPEESLVLKVSG